ncbi:hypothetical protein Cgig2_006260 [Carnegiea gigantea]|uniref:GOLD domain-containing protein n=1 Tax=Carnegiea gigantea TaxID=171969 RepID=A0A9Q1GJC7_9CARY|nr:hypothetical protein Cgig2_030304 [Carnegiea gigantea]KAJ8428786.1 hypothetical protein Cgig2_006260 [Carnegiea gigantea]
MVIVMLIALLMSVLIPACESLRFELLSGSTKCIAEEIKRDAMSVGKYTALGPVEGQPAPPSHRITARVTSPKGNNYHFGEVVEAGTFAFTAAETGDYMACFRAPHHKPPQRISVEFEWRTGIDAKDWYKVARKGQIELLDVELKRLHETVKSIHDEIFFLREREIEMQELNRATNSNMAIFSFLSLFLCLSVAGLQLWHLKGYFERKKLL